MKVRKLAQVCVPDQATVPFQRLRHIDAPVQLMEVRTEPEKSLLAVLEDAVLDCELTEHVGHFTDMHEFSHQGVHYGFAIVRTADDVLEIWIQRRRYVTENYLPKAVR